MNSLLGELGVAWRVQFECDPPPFWPAPPLPLLPAPLGPSAPLSSFPPPFLSIPGKPSFSLGPGGAGVGSEGIQVGRVGH